MSSLLFLGNLMLLFLSWFSMICNSRLESLLSLMGLLLWLSLILISLGLDFMGLMVVMLYVGAVSVMFLFMMVMLDDNEVGFSLSLGLSVLVLLSLLLILVCLWLGGVYLEVNLEELVMLDGSVGVMEVVGYYMLSESMGEVVLLGLLLLVGLVGGLRESEG